MFCQLFSLQNKSFLCLQHVENKGFQTVIKHRLKAIQKPIKNELGNREKNTKNAHFVLKKCTFRFRDYKSYMKISIAGEYQPFVYCLINSSLFFLLWIIISDGWHITKKELSFIKIPSNINNFDVWIHLMNRLENRLEDTKIYVGTKQDDYDYKHKKSKYIIDEIDEELSKVFNLDSSQLDYIKSFGLKYRLGDGA